MLRWNDGECISKGTKNHFSSRFRCYCRVDLTRRLARASSHKKYYMREQKDIHTINIRSKNILQQKWNDVELSSSELKSE